MHRHTQRKPNQTTPVVHHSPSARRPTEVAAIDMDQIWKDTQVEHAKWITLYAGILQGAMAGAMAAPPAKEGEPDEVHLDYEALAAETDQAYSRYAARLRGMR